MTQSEKISRRDEIRALFIFGLLAVLASIRVQNSQLIVTIGFGSVDLIPYIDFIIELWSLYAFFMILGLSGDVIGKRIADSFSGISIVFLQISYFTLAAFAFPLGLIAYGARFVLAIFLIILVGLVGLVIFLDKKHFSFRKWLKSLRVSGVSWNIKKRLPFIIGVVFLYSSYVMLTYPQTGFGSFEVPIIMFIVSAVTVTILQLLLEAKNDDTSTSDDD